MTIVGELETAVETAVPQARVARMVLIAACILLAGAALGFLLWWVLVRPAQAERQAAVSHAEAATATATTGAATDTVHIVVDHNQADAAIVARIQENTHAILSAKGASDQVAPDVARAGRAALCLSPAYRAAAECVALSQAGQGDGAARGDAGSAAPR